MKRFYLKRNADVSGISGTGNIAEGCLFDTGKVALTWLSEMPCVTVYDSVEIVIKVHGHDGRTVLSWIDEESSNVIVKHDKVVQHGRFRRLNLRHPDE
jgi:hypothetical protein